MPVTRPEYDERSTCLFAITTCLIVYAALFKCKIYYTETKRLMHSLITLMCADSFYVIQGQSIEDPTRYVPKAMNIVLVYVKQVLYFVILRNHTRIRNAIEKSVFQIFFYMFRSSATFAYFFLLSHYKVPCRVKFK